MIDAWMVAVALFAVCVAAVFYYIRSVYSYFDGTGIPTRPWLAFTGAVKIFLQGSNVAQLFLDIYKTHPTAKYTGFFDLLTPIVVIRDLDLVKSVTVKNFEHFQDHSTQTNPLEALFSKNLFSLRGERWKEMRTLLSPAFTSSKMKAMYKLMDECGSRYGDILATVSEEERSMELKDTFTRYTNDVIATCAFGVNVDSMTDRNNDFYVYGRTATNFKNWQMLKFMLLRCAPQLCRMLGIKIFDQKIVDFFYDLVASTIKTRDEQGIVRPDMIQLMMETRGKLGPGKELTIEDMTAQAFIFFFGGFESTSTLMCFAAYEVGVNPDVQKRLQEEIDEVLGNSKGEVSYEAINDMKYLDAIIHEALRVYPAAVGTDRICTKPFELPPTLPGAKPYTIKKDDSIWIPIYGIHYDPQYFEEPTKFNPDRFLDDSKKFINAGMLLSFGMGPRMCIGNRFALLETKILLFHVFARCNLVPNEKTPIPMKLKGFQMTADGGFWFDVVPRKIDNSVCSGDVTN
nr:cytochrome P450 9e2-like [Nomia melanderi]